MVIALTCQIVNSSRRAWIASLAMTFGLASQATGADENTKVNNLPEKSDRTALVQIIIETSRSQPTAGDGLGVSAEIKNVSDSTIHIEGKEISLVLPPELEGPGRASTGMFALLPTEPPGPKEDPWKVGIELAPGDSYKVFWTQGIKYEADLDQQWYIRKIYNVIVSEMNFIFFPPGDYKVAVVCKYSPVVNSSPAPSRTTVQTATIHVAAPQFVILFGAALGGLLAYFILPQARKKLMQPIATEQTRTARIVSRTVRELAGIVGAVLLSTMITILLSRISETQFLIKVTITDLWGAIAIGFVANYVGAKALNKVLSGFDQGGTGDHPEVRPLTQSR